MEENFDNLQIQEKQIKRIRRKYKKYKQEHGAEIKEIYYITRDEPFPHIYENADFSPKTIKESIKEGEIKANQSIQNKRNNKGKEKSK